jgi:pSer/pThr/pTyr-binding forkhead associated (FHA) protein
MPILHIYHQDEFRWKFTLFDEEVLIGRDHGNHIVLPLPTVSRQHAIIRRKEKGFVIEDQSGKGLQVNDKTVSHATLKHDDSICIKGFRLIFKFEEKDHHPEKQTIPRTTPKDTRGIPSWRLPLREDQTLHNDQPLHEDRTQPLLVRYEVRVISGADQGLSCPIRGEVITVGRSPRNRLVLTDPAVSNFHLEITPSEKGLALRDIGSTNGTYVEDHKILHATVPMGSEIRVGETYMIFTIEEKVKPAIVELYSENLKRTDDFLFIEKRVIERSLNAHKGDRKAVAKVMGISLSALNDKIREYGIIK